MIKARITVTVVFDYKLDTDWYPKGALPEEMVAMEIESHENIDNLMGQITNGAHASISVRGELLEEV